MPSPAPLAQGFLYSLFWILLAQVPPQSVSPASQLPRTHLTQDQLCWFDMHVVNPIYPREARVSHTQGVVKLIIVFADNGSVAEVQAISGDPVPLDSTMKAVRQWHFSLGGRSVGSGPRETEVPLSFTFKIEDPPEPAFLHLSNGQVIRADNVREFADGIEYTVGRRTHRISPDSVTDPVLRRTRDLHVRRYATTAPYIPRVAPPAGRLRSKAVTGN
jgi:hypothetical protein